jgi:hypothetical protein
MSQTDNPGQKAPFPGQSVDLVPDESPITIADMIRQEGGSIPKAMKRQREDVARRAIASSSSPPSAPATMTSAGRIGSPQSIEAIRTGTQPSSRGVPDAPDVLDGLTSDERLEEHRKKFGELEGQDLISAVSVGQEWPGAKTDWVRGTLDDLRRDAPEGDWQLTNEDMTDGTMTFIDLNTGEETEYRWDGEE